MLVGKELNPGCGEVYRLVTQVRLRLKIFCLVQMRKWQVRLD